MSKLNMAEKKYLVERMHEELARSQEPPPRPPSALASIKESLKAGIVLPIRAAAAIRRDAQNHLLNRDMYNASLPLELVFQPSPAFLKHEAAVNKQIEKINKRNNKKRAFYNEARDRVMMGQAGVEAIKELAKQLETVK